MSSGACCRSLIALLVYADPLLAEEAARQTSEPTPFTTDAGFCIAHELRLVVASLYHQALSSLRTVLVGGGRGHGATMQTEKQGGNIATPEQLAARIRELREWLKQLTEHTQRSLPPSDADWKPCVVRISEAYQLSECERDAFILLLLLRSHTTDVFGTCFDDLEGVEDGFVDDKVLRSLCGMSAVEAKLFFDEESALCKDGVIVVRESDYRTGHKRAALSFEAVELMQRGPPATTRLPGEASDGGRAAAARAEKLMLKLSGTKLLEIISPSAAAAGSSTEAVVSSGRKAADQEGEQGGAVGVAAPEAPKASGISADDGAVGHLLAKLDGGAPYLAAQSKEAAAAQGEHVAARQAEEEVAEEEEAAAAAEAAGAPAGGGSGGGGDDTAGDGEAPLRGYDNELEYLDDQFSALVQRIQLSAELAKQRVKHAEVEDATRPWYDKTPARRVNMAELRAKVKLIEGKIRLRLGRAGKLGTPRLEVLCQRLSLDEFQRSVLLMACGNTISPVVRALLASSTSRSSSLDAEELTVGRVLQVLTTSFHEQVQKRIYFYKSGALVRKGLIRLTGKTYSRGNDDLTDNRITLDRRVLDCLVGLDRESEEVAGESANLYTPTVELDDVVLAEGVRERLLTMLAAHESLRCYSRKVGLAKAIPQPEGMVLMLCGPSGSGKTMTANAVARRLGRKVLLVNFPLLRAEKSGGVSPQSILREAELANAVVFFDECESLFAQRGAGGSSEMTELLTEIERFEGLIFLATNRPADIDEAMYRRLTAVFEFSAPNHRQRAQIWQRLTAPAAIPLAPNVQIEAIALKYELTGGFIRNAVLAALLRAVGRDPTSPMVTQADLHEGCRQQMRGALQLADIAPNTRGLVSSARTLEDLVLPPALRTALHTLLRLEKARPVLQSEWGFTEAYARRGGVTALFWGPAGAGKRTAAEALAFELGKPVRVVHFAALLNGTISRNSSGNLASISTLFKESRLADALLLISGVDPSVDSAGLRGEHERALQLLLFEMERYPGVVILCVAAAVQFEAVAHQVHPGILGAMKAVIPFKLPDVRTRVQLWTALLPPECPLQEGLDVETLARESAGFSASRIQSCLYRAAGFAVMAETEGVLGSEPEAKPEVATAQPTTADARLTAQPTAADASGTLEPASDAGTAAHRPSLRMAELLRIVKEEHDKDRGTRDSIQRSMLL
jgi:SpoVK/Ycf46/Vps4 family AAA+-type ATPase